DERDEGDAADPVGDEQDMQGAREFDVVNHWESRVIEAPPAGARSKPRRPKERRSLTLVKAKGGGSRLFVEARRRLLDHTQDSGKAGADSVDVAEIPDRGNVAWRRARKLEALGCAAAKGGVADGGGATTGQSRGHRGWLRVHLSGVRAHAAGAQESLPGHRLPDGLASRRKGRVRAWRRGAHR